MSTLWSVERKIRWCAYLLFAASSVAVVTVLLPATVREAYIGEEPLFVPLSVAGIGGLSVVTVFGAAVGLFWVAYRSRRPDEIPEDAAWTLVGVEEILSAFAFVMGTMGVVACLAAVSTGVWGVEFVDSLSESGVRPYRSDSALALPLAYVAAPAFFAGVVVLALAEYASSLREG